MRYRYWGFIAVAGGVMSLSPLGKAAAQSAESSSGAAPGASAGQAVEEVEITVIGIRKALEAAQEVKRNSALVVEAITPEDLGKFTDDSIADELQRLPGVQIDRGNDGRSGDHISIRGIGAEYVTTTINGRTPGGYGKEGQQFLREFAVDVLPSEILSGAKVYKSSSAELVEAGMGGEVDYETLRPLDYHPKSGNAYFGNTTIKGQDNQGAGRSRWGDSFSGILGGHFAEDTLGVVVAGLSSRNRYQTDWSEGNSVSLQTVNLQDSSGAVSQQSVVFPNNVTVGRTRRNDQRKAFSGAIQWKPNDAWDINLDYLYSKYDRPDNRDTYVINYNTNNALGGTFLPGGITIVDGAVTGLDYSKYVPPAGSSGLGVNFGFPLGYNNDSTTQIGGVNTRWSSDRVSANLDLSLNQTHTRQDLAWFYSQLTYPSLSDSNYSGNTSGPPTLNAGAPSYSSASDYNTIGALRRFFQTSNDGGAARLDVAFKISDQYTLKAGVRYSETDVDARNAYTSSFALTPSQLGLLQGVLYPGGTDTLLAGYNLGSLGRVPAQSPNGVNWNAFFPAVDSSLAPLGGPFWNASQSQGSWSGSTDPQIGYIYADQERISALYGQLDFKSEWGGIPADGNLGARLVQTRERLRAFQTITTQNDAAATQLSTQSFVPAETTARYINVLPAASLNLHPLPQMNWRFSAGEAMSRPEYLDMVPDNNVTVPSAALHQANPSIVGTGTAGNPSLKPATSWNFDTTLEYYTHAGASYVGSLFYKKVSNFIAPVVTYNQTLPGYGNQFFNLNQPQNMSQGHADGLELGMHQPLGPWLPVLDGFGIQVNYTYVSSAIDKPISGQQETFPGVSKNNLNGIVYYNKGSLDARVAMVYRSSYLSQFPWAGYVPFPVSTDASTTVDATMTYLFNDHFSLTVTGTNLTRSNRRDYLFNTAVFEHFYTVPRSFAVAVRAAL